MPSNEAIIEALRAEAGIVGIKPSRKREIADEIAKLGGSVAPEPEVETADAEAPAEQAAPKRPRKAKV